MKNQNEKTVEQTVDKFLRFNDKEILFRKIDGQYWVALKPICEALNVNYHRAQQNLREDEFLSEPCASQHMVGADGSSREMISLPEFFIYGWMFQLNAKSDEYKQYKWKCFEVLHDYFNGTITKRASILENQHNERKEAITLRKNLKAHPDYLRLKEIEDNTTARNKRLKQLDHDLLSGQTQIEL